MSQEMVQLDTTRAGVGIVTLVRPALGNGLNAEAVAQFNQILADLRVADGVRLVLVRGEGEDFCAGTDMEWLTASQHYTHDDHLSDAHGVAELLHRLDSLPQATVALVDGLVNSAGAGLVAACDIAVATRAVRFAFADVRDGLAPSLAAPYLVRTIGAKAARRIFCLAGALEAEDALRLGLIDQVVSDAAGLARAEEAIAKAVFAAAPGAVAACKELVAMVADHPLDKGVRDHTASHYAKRRMTDEGKEGVAALIEGRSPVWAKS